MTTSQVQSRATGVIGIYDVAVIGLGAVGSSALYALARHGAHAIGIDRFDPPHAFGSSHGETRITRQAIGEGQAYVPLVFRSNAILEAIEAETGESLLERCGFLLIVREGDRTTLHGKSGFFASTVRAARKFAIPHEILGSAELSRRFPQFMRMAGDERAYYEPGGGLVRPERCIAALLKLARAAGARTEADSPVSGITRVNGDFRVSLPGGEVIANRVILATGAWIGELAPRSIAPHVKIYRQTSHWFRLLDSSPYQYGATPTFYWCHGLDSSQQFYGFPPVDGHIKVALEQYATEWATADLSREVAIEEQRAIAASHVSGRLAGVAPQAARAKACLYTVTQDADFLIEAESDPGIIAISACSGHGFKHAPAVGEAVAARALGLASAVDLTAFSSDRLRA